MKQFFFLVLLTFSVSSKASESMEKPDDHNAIQMRIDRMLDRWAGVKHEVVRKNPTNESIEERSADVAVQSGVNVFEPARSIEVLASTDVLVVGGGPSGIAAALAAKRAGADTILMERFGCFGGVITTVGMETLGWYRYEGTVESEGIGIEMERVAAEMGGTIKWPYNDSPCLDADFFKVVADRLIKEAGVRPILHISAVEVIMDGNKILGVITESKSGRKAILAKRVIDCTGDADIAYLAGAKYRKTAKEEMMGVTTVFSVAGVDKAQFLRYTEENPRTYADWSKGTWEQETSGKENHLATPYFSEEFAKAKELGVIPNDTKGLGGSWSALSDAGEATNLNLAHMKGMDCTNVLDLTDAEMRGRTLALQALMSLKAVVPGFTKAKLRNFGMTLGCRDSRKIIGRHNLSGEEVRNQARFPDSIGIFPEFIDGYNILILPTTGRYFEVPYGCMVPEGVDNLLVAGRAVAGDKDSHAAMRNMMACTVTGQGAGVAAAISLREGKNTQEVGMEAIQQELVRQGVRLH